VNNNLNRPKPLRLSGGLAAQGSEYVLSNFRWPTIIARYEEMLEAV